MLEAIRTGGLIFQLLLASHPYRRGDGENASPEERLVEKVAFGLANQKSVAKL